MKHLEITKNLRIVIDGYETGVVGVSREVRNTPNDEWGGFGSWIDIPAGRVDEFFAAVRAEAKASMIKKK